MHNCNGLKNIVTLKLAVRIFCNMSNNIIENRSRFLRNIDRDMNTENYPNLNYPEIYLLKDGYKSFFEHHIVRKQRVYIIIDNNAYADYL